MEAPLSEVCWTPDEATIAASHVSRLMRDRGVRTVPDLHRWTVEHPSTFWSHVAHDLGVVFDEHASEVLDASDPQRPKWFPGARMNIVRSCLEGDDDALAIVESSDDGIQRITRAELRSRVTQFASGFVDAGYEPGDRVAIAMPMTSDAVVAYLGTIAAGGVVVSIADSFAPDEIAVRLGLTDVVAIVTQDVTRRAGRTLPMYEKCTSASSAPCIVVDTGAGAPLRAQDVTWSEFQGARSTLHPVSSPPDGHTNILFSSGTTGEPKAIPWNHTTPLKAAMDGRYHHDIHDGDVVAWPTNLGWMMGPWLIYASLLNGAAMALHPDAPTTRDFIAFVDSAGVTMLGLVPSIVAAWRANDVLVPGDLATVRVLSSTGEASNPDDYRWLMDTVGAPVIEYCGGTEIGGGYITGTVVQSAIPSRFTTPAFGIDIAILDDAGQPADSGECFLIGPSIGLSTELVHRDHGEVYFSGAPEGMRRHGDHIERMPDGTYRARGRMDDTMNLGGIKTSSAELEEVLATVPGVTDVAAVSVPPPEGGPERLVVHVVVVPGRDTGDALRGDLQDALRTRLNPLFRIADVVVVDELPRTASHKVMRRVLREEYGR
jgi:acetyl-CoA synthetase